MNKSRHAAQNAAMRKPKVPAQSRADLLEAATAEFATGMTRMQAPG
jgi:hypothetical protein